MESEIMLLGLVALGGGLTVALIGLAYLLLRLREAETRLHEKEDQHQGILDRLQENEYRLRTIIESEPECVKLQAADGTVRKLYGTSIERNAIHGSDSPENAVKELAFYFSSAELIAAR